MIRQPAVAGQFYSASPEALSVEVAGYLDASACRQPAIAAICPHAGLMYSGHVAGAVFSRLALPPTVVLVGPNHTGVGPAVSVYPEGSWAIPGSEIAVDQSLAADILARCPRAEADTTAHRFEHCLEVQLPFLRAARADIQIVPIVLGTTRADICRDLGLCLAQVVQATITSPLLIASTDMSHYEPDGVTRQKDRWAIEAIQNLDPAALETAVRTHRITMCGYAPTAAVLHAARALRATSAALIRYATSGDINGELDRVVGYAGFVIT